MVYTSHNHWQRRLAAIIDTSLSARHDAAFLAYSPTVNIIIQSNDLLAIISVDHANITEYSLFGNSAH